MLSYRINSFKITIPTVIGAVAISCMTGFALASYKFKANLFIFFTFIASNKREKDKKICFKLI